MKTIKLIPVLLLLLLIVSCSSVNVNSDYDKTVNFSNYRTYAFYKSGIDKVEISDLDKKRILFAIEGQMAAKGFIKSETPDLLINIFTKTREQLNVDQYNSYWGYGWGYGWNPYLMYNYPSTSVSSSTQGTLFIDFIDAKKKQLVWQGVGMGEIDYNVKNKDEKIINFVAKILAQYPPNLSKK